VDYITKPFHADEVLARVENHLMLRNLQKRLEEKNEALTEALEQLKATQNQLILQEKMAALGHLVAGVAHEINTPLGAIRASISNISNALSASVQELPQLFQQLSPERQADFFALIRAALSCQENFSSREARKMRRKLRGELEDKQIHDAEFVSNTLVNMGICQDISRFISLLREKNNALILRTAYNLFVQENNSRNIMTAVERASKVVFALKSYARHDDSGRMTTAKVTEGLDVVLTLYHNHLKHGIDVIREYEDVPEIHCYPDELNQVWTNLIHNAIHAMEGKGELTVSVSEQEGQIVVRITDSGSGIPDTVQNRIFEPFFTTKAPGEGSGLGLDIVWKIIERHQGNIKVNSQPGRTTFSIFLPLNHSEII
jgi:signal transduction histidine kinase